MAGRRAGGRGRGRGADGAAGARALRDPRRTRSALDFQAALPAAAAAALLLPVLGLRLLHSRAGRGAGQRSGPWRRARGRRDVGRECAGYALDLLCQTGTRAVRGARQEGARAGPRSQMRGWRRWQLYLAKRSGIRLRNQRPPGGGHLAGGGSRASSDGCGGCHH